MLVLSRKKNESIVIGDDIEVTVVHVHPHRVRIGIKAPEHIRVLRSELQPFGATGKQDDEDGGLFIDLPRPLAAK